MLYLLAEYFNFEGLFNLVRYQRRVPERRCLPRC